MTFSKSLSERSEDSHYRAFQHVSSFEEAVFFMFGDNYFTENQRTILVSGTIQ